MAPPAVAPMNFRVGYFSMRPLKARMARLAVTSPKRATCSTSR